MLLLGVFVVCFLLGALRLEPWLGLPIAGAIACSFLRETIPSVVGATFCVAAGELAFGLPPGAWAMGAGIGVIILRQLMRQGPPDWIDCFVAGIPLAILALITSFTLSFLSAMPPALPSLFGAASFLVTGMVLSRPLAFYLLGEEVQRPLS